jgi:cytochrome c-type biogenesis protein CcmH/NrfF
MGRVDGVCDDESVAGSIASATVSLDMRDSVASLDGEVQTLEEGVEQMEIVDEEVSHNGRFSYLWG